MCHAQQFRNDIPAHNLCITVVLHVGGHGLIDEQAENSRAGRLSFKMAYEKLQKSDENDLLPGHDSDRIMRPVEMKSLGRDDGTTSPVEDTPIRLQEAESEDNDSIGVVGTKEDESLVRNEIDENGLTQDYEVALKYTGFGFFHILLLVVNGIALSSDAIEVLSIAYILPIIREKDEFDTADWQTALLSSIIFLGMLFGSYFWGSLSDLSGRRCTLLISLTVNGVFGLCSAFAPNYSVFLVFRFLSGFGLVFMTINCTLYQLIPSYIYSLCIMFFAHIPIHAHAQCGRLSAGDIHLCVRVHPQQVQGTLLQCAGNVLGVGRLHMWSSCLGDHPTTQHQCSDGLHHHPQLAGVHCCVSRTIPTGGGAVFLPA